MPAHQGSLHTNPQRTTIKIHFISNRVPLCLPQAAKSMDKEGHLPTGEHINRTDQTLQSPLLCTEVWFCLESLIKLDHHQGSLRIINSTNYLVPSMLCYYRIFIHYLHSQTQLSWHIVASAAAGTWAITARAWQCDTDFKDIGIRAFKSCVSCLEITTMIEKHIRVQEIIKRVSFTHPRFLWDQTWWAWVKLHPIFGNFLAFTDTVKSIMNLMISSFISDSTHRNLTYTCPTDLQVDGCCSYGIINWWVFWWN